MPLNVAALSVCPVVHGRSPDYCPHESRRDKGAFRILAGVLVGLGVMGSGAAAAFQSLVTPAIAGLKPLLIEGAPADHFATRDGTSNPCQAAWARYIDCLRDPDPQGPCVRPDCDPGDDPEVMMARLLAEAQRIGLGYPMPE